MTSTENNTARRAQLTALIDQGCFQIRFQPIVDLQAAAIAGFEALTAPGAETGFEHAGALFDAAQEERMLWPLERATRRAALRAAAGWPPGSLLFLNCSPEVFANDEFPAAILESIRSVPGLTPGRVVLEITEKSETHRSGVLSDQVERLKAEGFQIAIDDVGAGESGLNRIMALRPHWLKLDRELVRAIDGDHVRQNLIRFLIHFAKLSGVRVIAEGIETREELATLVDLGVAFGQGYYLGRPGGRDQSLAEPVTGWIRDRWARAEAIRFHDPRHARIARFMRPVVKVDADRTVGDVVAELMRDASVPGVAVVVGERCAGWCDRETLLRAAATVQVVRPIGYLVGPDVPPATAQTTVAEALELAASREERHAGKPLLVEEAGEVVGLIAIRDLLHAAAETSRELNLRTVPLTGLPGRVRAEQHIRALIAAARRPEAAAAASDAAMIDIRNLGHYNGVYGYDLGDQLLKRLVALLQSTVVGEDTSVFVAHLGDDRFLVTAPRGRMEPRLRQLIRGFDASLMAVSEPGGAGEPEAGTIGEELGSLAASFVQQPAGIGLRVMLLRGVFGVVASPRDLHRMMDELRRQIRTSHLAVETAGSLSVIDAAQMQDLRRTA